MYINRKIKQKILNRLGKGKAVLLFGPRQSGKTTLVKKLLAEYDPDALFLNADDYDIRERLSETTATALKRLFGKHKTVFIDEAQRIFNIGITLKLCTDQIPDVQIIASGSSAFELQNKTGESLTGRKYEFTLLPFSFEELVEQNSLINEMRLLEHRMIFGMYPEIVTSLGDEEELLRLFASSYLYKDILAAGAIKKPIVLEKLLRVLALQIGSQVSYHELANLVGVSSSTIESYIDLLEKLFVVFRLPAFVRNVRNEIKKGKKIYFYDNGIRNAIIGNFNHVTSRNDIGALFENYLMSERQKYLLNHFVFAKTFFWRTTQKQEIDYIEENNERLYAYEFKWNPLKKARLSKTFSTAYPNHEFRVVNRKNYDNFLIKLQSTPK